MLGPSSPDDVHLYRWDHCWVPWGWQDSNLRPLYLLKWPPVLYPLSYNPGMQQPSICWGMIEGCCCLPLMFGWLFSCRRLVRQKVRYLI